MANKIYVNIDLGNHTFKIGVFARKRNKLVLLKTLVEKIDFNIADNFKESVPAIAGKINEMLSKLDVKGRSVLLYLSLPGSLTFCRLLKLPLVDRAKIHQIVQYEAQQQVPFSLEEVIWNYQILGHRDPEHLHVMLVAVRQELIQDLLTALLEHHLDVEFIEASPIASYHSISQLLPSTGETLVLINIGSRATNLIIYTPQTVWVRTVMIGGNHFTHEIQKELKLGFEEAEELKKKNGTLNEEARSEKTLLDTKLIKAIDVPAKRLIAEVTRSFGHYNTHFDGKAISKAYLTGGGSKIRNLDTYLAKKLSIPVEMFDPFQSSLIETPQTLQGDPFLFTEVLGLGMHTVKAPALNVNLLPKAYIAERAIAQKREYVFLSALAAFLILICLILYYNAVAGLQQSTLNNATTTLNNLKTYASDIKNHIHQNETISKQTEEVQKLVREKKLWLSIFSELQKHTPPSVWLDKFTTAYVQKANLMVQRSKGSPTGAMILTLFCKTTGTYKDVSNFRDALEQSELFQDVQIRSANPPLNGIRDFVIQIEVQE
jgi:type IV pilus assembly protein PilM